MKEEDDGDDDESSCLAIVAVILNAEGVEVRRFTVTG